MARVVFNNTFFSLVCPEVEIAPRRRACSENSHRQRIGESNVIANHQAERLTAMLGCQTGEKPEASRSEILKLPLASQLRLSSLASMGLMSLQERFAEVGTAGCSDCFPSKARSPGYGASSDSASTMAPEDSDSSKDVSFIARKPSVYRPNACHTGSNHPRAKLGARSRREKTKASVLQKHGGGSWAYLDASQMFMGATWMPAGNAPVDWWQGAGAPRIGCAEVLWSQQHVDAA